MTEGPLNVMALNYKSRQALLSDNRLVPITHWYDPDGDECEIDEAVSCVCGSDETGWFSVLLNEFEFQRMH